jgi:hypothetical protein
MALAKKFLILDRFLNGYTNVKRRNLQGKASTTAAF